MPLVKEPNAEPIPGYRLIEPLGSGGFGEVWKCEAPGGIFKAIKFVYGDTGVQGTGATPLPHSSRPPNKTAPLNAPLQADEELRAVQLIKSIRHPFWLSIDRVEVVD